MDRYIKPIGGEFYFQHNIYNNEARNFVKNENNMNFLSGGQSSLAFIFQALNLKEDEYVLIPSYLCPTMLIKLKESRIKYAFYSINKDLSIDINSIEDVLNEVNVKGILFINYFGFYHSISTRKYISSLKKRNIKIIEDSVQMLWFNKQNNFIGDFVFNSYRKFLPIDGSLLICNEKISLQDTNHKYYEIINRARSSKTLCIGFNIGNEEEYLDLFNKAEEYYYEDLSPRKIDETSKKLLDNIDINYINKRRIDNFIYLEKSLEAIKEIKPLFSSTEIEAVPLGYVIFVENRDELRRFLMKNRVYCPVHWNLKNEEWIEEYDNSLYISQRILTIPIDQRYDIEDMKRIVNLIEEFYFTKRMCD